MPPSCASSSCISTLGSGFSQPEGVEVDGSGDVFVGDTSHNAVKEMPSGCASSSCVTTLGGGFSNPFGMAVDGSGDVYVADNSNNAMKKLNFADAPSLSFAATLVNTTYSDSPQTVTISNIGNATLTFPLPGTGTNPSVAANFAWDNASTCTQTSGLPVHFASTTSSVCSALGTAVTILSVGTCTIQATQLGSTDYSAATPVLVNFTIN